MKIISWNVNGLRAVVKKDKWDQIFELAPDIICLQETKAHPDQLPEEVRNPLGYTSFFDHSKVKKGYSGVAVFTKIKPEKVEYGLGKEDLDQEGRFLALFFKSGELTNEKTVLINCYFPNGGGGPARLDFKMRYYSAFTKYCENLRKKGHEIIFCGDVNTAHNEIDLARPKENENSTGFLKMEREWIDDLVALGYVDTFRYLYPKEIKYSWWDMKTFARERNIGWRIDYFFVSKGLTSKIKKAFILNDILGSDHCPVGIEVK